MTLMSKTHYNFRRSFVCFVALLQLAVVPATYSLHIGCEHAHSDGHHNSGVVSAVVSCFSGHHCDCSHHATDERSGSESPSPEKPHDSHSCPVCQAAFATSTADFSAPGLTQFAMVSALPQAGPCVPESAERYRSKSRGPPSHAAVS